MRKTTKRFAIGSLVAAVIGYLAGILTAPKSGKETRKDIKEAAVKAKTEAEKQLKKLHSELDNLVKRGTSQISKLKSGAQKELLELLDKAKKAKAKAKEMLSAIHEGGADDKDLEAAITESKKAAEHLKNYLAKQTKQ